MTVIRTARQLLLRWLEPPLRHVAHDDVPDVSINCCQHPLLAAVFAPSPDHAGLSASRRVHDCQRDAFRLGRQLVTEDLVQQLVDDGMQALLGEAFSACLVFPHIDVAKTVTGSLDRKVHEQPRRTVRTQAFGDTSVEGGVDRHVLGECVHHGAPSGEAAEAQRAQRPIHPIYCRINMPDRRRHVKPLHYDGSSRRAASAATRQRIVDVARDLFAREGYRTTTIGRIASAARVNPDTVYELVGRKPVLLRELIEQALSGTDHAIAAEQRPAIAAIIAEPDPERKLRGYAAVMRQTHQRLAPMFLAAREAASTDPDAASVWHEIAERRATNMRRLAGDLHRTGRLRRNLTIDEAADIVWATNSPEMWILLTGARGWTPAHYERWLAETWIRLLLD